MKKLLKLIVYLIITAALLYVIFWVVVVVMLIKDFFYPVTPDDPSKSGWVNKGVYAPKENPRPKYFMTVKGRITPALLSKKLILKWKVGYRTTNPECEVIIYPSEEIKSYRRKTIHFKSNPDSQGNFENKIALDKFLPGCCHWQVEYIDYSIGDIKSTEVVSFSKSAHPAITKAVNEHISCLDGRCNYVSGKSYNNEMEVNPKDNYFFNIFINKRVK